MDQVVIRVDNVSKNFALPHEKARSLKEVFVSPFRTAMHKNVTAQHALKNISFEVKKGEFFGIVGRNGSGKSTLLKMLAGIYQPSSGSVSVQGKLVPFIELGVGFNPELTGRENVYLNGALLGFSEKEIDSMYDEIVAFAELSKFMDQKLKNYSSGMQVRLAFSMAVRADTDILLIDEVLAVGDADFQRKCYDYFQSLKKNHKTVVFVSHDMDAVREFCDRAILVEKGVVTESGDTGRVADRYASLFISKEKSAKTKSINGKNALREGSGWALIEKATLNHNVVTDQDDTLTLTVAIRVEHEHKNLMTGFAIKDGEGRHINGTNTWEIRSDLPVTAVGKTCLVEWSFPNIYRDGVYTIDLYVYGDGNEKYDDIKEALSFQSKRARRSGFLVVPRYQIKAIAK